MAKVEIEVPKGKIADVTKDGDRVIVTFKEADILERLKTFEDVLDHLEKLADNGASWAFDLICEYNSTEKGSYSEVLTKYRMVVAALTNNEQRHLTTGEKWYPVVQFCKEDKIKNCWGDCLVGHIVSEGIKYAVVGGSADNGLNAGLGNFNSYNGVSASYTDVGFRSVSSEKVAKHISTYFSKLLFEVHYGGTNCAWRWAD